MVRKHGLDVTLHGDYRREPFHCESALQSLQEIEGENAAGERGTAGSPEECPTPTPTPTHASAGDDLTLKPSRRLGRQESPLSRDSFLTGREKAAPEVTKVTKSPVNREAATSLQAEPVKAKEASAEKPQPSQVAVTSTALAPKVTAGDRSPFLSTSSTVATSSSCGAKTSEKGPATLVTPSPSPLVQEQKQLTSQVVKSTSSPAQGLDKGKALGSGGQAQDKAPTPKADTTEVTKPGKGPETTGKDGPSTKEGTWISEKLSESKAKAPVPPASHPGPAALRPNQGKISGATNSQRGTREEKRFLEVVEEHPASPSPTALSPSSSKSRAASPGDRASFVTQLTSVAKTVLGPMKLGSQDGSKTKDGSPKVAEEKRGGSSGKSETLFGSRRGATGTWPGPSGSSKSDKAKSSSKHH